MGYNTAMSSMKASITLTGNVSDLSSLEKLLQTNKIEYSFPMIGSRERYHEFLVVLCIAKEWPEVRRKSENQFLRSVLPAGLVILNVNMPKSVLPSLFDWYDLRNEERMREWNGNLRQRLKQAFKRTLGLSHDEKPAEFEVFVETDGTVTCLGKEKYEDFIRYRKLNKMFRGN
jgi:hypothetical protein